jgi:hypothetical protein
MAEGFRFNIRNKAYAGECGVTTIADFLVTQLIVIAAAALGWCTGLEISWRTFLIIGVAGLLAELKEQYKSSVALQAE